MLGRKLLEVREQYLRQLPAMQTEGGPEGPAGAAGAAGEADQQQQQLPESGLRQEELLQWYIDAEAMRYGQGMSRAVGH